MALDLDTLLAPVSEDNPVGEDLSYDNDRATLEQTFEVGDGLDGAPTEEKDWRSVLKIIESQFARTKDVWLATYLCRAGAMSGSLETVELGAQALAGLFEQYWATVHPQLEELGVPGRKAPCDSLVARGPFLAPLEKTILIAHPRLGRFSGIDLERFRIGKEAEEGYGMFRAALEELGEESLNTALERLKNIEEALRRADKIFTAEAVGEDSTNFSPTYAVLQTLQQSVSSFIPEPVIVEPEEEEEEGGVGEAGPSGGGGSSKSFAGAVKSRQDVLRALTAVADYYRDNEPSHPVQHLVHRARLWVDLDFMSLLRDIAPVGLDDADRLLNGNLQQN